MPIGILEGINQGKFLIIRLLKVYHSFSWAISSDLLPGSIKGWPKAADRGGRVAEYLRRSPIRPQSNIMQAQPVQSDQSGPASFMGSWKWEPVALQDMYSIHVGPRGDAQNKTEGCRASLTILASQESLVGGF